MTETNENVVEMRGQIFKLYYDMYMNMNKLEPKLQPHLIKNNIGK